MVRHGIFYSLYWPHSSFDPQATFEEKAIRCNYSVAFMHIFGVIVTSVIVVVGVVVTAVVSVIVMSEDEAAGGSPRLDVGSDS